MPAPHPPCVRPKSFHVDCSVRIVPVAASLLLYLAHVGHNPDDGRRSQQADTQHRETSLDTPHQSACHATTPWPPYAKPMNNIRTILRHILVTVVVAALPAYAS